MTMKTPARSELPIFIGIRLISSFVTSWVFILPLYLLFNPSILLAVFSAVIFFIYIFLCSTIPPIINMIVEERMKAYFKLMTLDGELELQFVKKN